MNTQHGLILTKEVEGNTLTLSHISNNTFKLKITEGNFKVGKGAAFADGTSINQPMVEGNSVIITKAEMKRLGTYKLYLNGKDVAATIFSKWIDNKGRQVIFLDESDFYYYFNRPDCGLVQVNNINGEHCITEFHYALGRTKGSGINANKAIEVLEK
jgi:hypothetical protein